MISKEELICIGFIEQSMDNLKNIYKQTKDKDINLEGIQTINKMLMDMRYTVAAIYADDKALRELNYREFEEKQVYLFDKERNMFWKNSHGYTLYISEASLWPLRKAQEICNEDMQNNTKIVSFID